LSVESNLKPRVQYLAESCDLDPTELTKMVQTSNGSVLSLSVEKNLKPTMDFLLEEMFDDDESDKNSDPRALLKKCVLTHPQLLGLSLANLESKVNYFHSIGPSLAVRIARKCPAIYSLNLDQNIVPTIEFLAKVWGTTSKLSRSSKKKSSRDGFVPMLHEYPNIITLSVEANLQPTMMFFNKTGYTLLNENWELAPSSNKGRSSASKSSTINGKHTVVNRIRGRYIAASLYNRLLPRWHYCISSGTDDPNSEKDAGSVSVTKNALLMPSESSSLSSPQPPKTPSLHLLVMASDEFFCEAMGFQLGSFLNFKRDAIPRLKFSSQFDTWLKTGKPIDL